MTLQNAMNDEPPQYRTETVARTAVHEARSVAQAAALGTLGLLAMIASMAIAIWGVSAPPCLFRSWIGLPCPLCGMTRSITCLWHGDFVGSVRHHPLGIVAASAWIAMTIVASMYLASPQHRAGIEARLARLRRTPITRGVVAAGMILWAVRLVDAFSGWGVFRW